MPISVGVGGAHKTVTAIWVGAGGAWKQVTSLKVGVGGAWKESMARINESLPNSSNEFSTEWELGNDGMYSVGNGAGGANTGAWVTPSDTTIAAQFSVTATLVSGTVETGTFGSELALSTTRTWIKTTTGTATIQFQFSQGGTVVNTQSVDLTVT